MARSCKDSVLLLIVVVLISCSSTPISYCAKKPVGLARKEDVPFIKCQVCEKLAAQLHQQVQIKQVELAPKKISEFQIIEIAENLCNLKKKEADWILKIDIVEHGDALELAEQDSEGQCNSECKTIERACQEVLGYYDTDVAEFVYKSKPEIDSLVRFICKDLTKACGSKPPPVPMDRIPGEPFIKKTAKEAEMEKLLKSMDGIPGAPGMKMYSREDLMSQDFGGGDTDNEDDDEDDLALKLGRALKEKESKRYDWKEKISRVSADAIEKVKYHAGRASFRLRQWLRSKKSKSGEAEL